MTARLAVVGGGKMGGALVAGLLRAGWARPEDLVVVGLDAKALPDPRLEKRAECILPGLLLRVARSRHGPSGSGSCQCGTKFASPLGGNAHERGWRLPGRNTDQPP